MLDEAEEDVHVVLHFADTDEAGTNAAATEQSSNKAAMMIKQDGGIMLSRILFTECTWWLLWLWLTHRG